ncbi:ABC transporter substrate-binding protein [Bifidobacterium aquikefiricola]|uniref:ABC transporter substrate-binding protein n=1 Tax=Bifidobacterium aquikefiricola TaxID=3059038 RepID=A0AB39U625_9BIFI
MNSFGRKLIGGVLTGVVMMGTVGCGSSNPLDSSSSQQHDASTITIGSANFAESEILANIYAQALSAHGIHTALKPDIGARDVYIAALKDGSIDLVPEYTGNLLQYVDKDSTAHSAEDVYSGLKKALPSTFAVLNQSQAEDSDSINVTKSYSEQHHVTSIGDLSSISGLKVAAAPEFATRPYGIKGLKQQYGVDATLVPINDGGGATTIKALLDGTVQMANINTTSPSIKANDLVTLKDPQQMILPQRVIPLISKTAESDKVASVLNDVQSKLTTQDLMTMNGESINDKESASAIAKRWLQQNKLV